MRLATLWQPNRECLFLMPWLAFAIYETEDSLRAVEQRRGRGRSRVDNSRAVVNPMAMARDWFSASSGQVRVSSGCIYSLYLRREVYGADYRWLIRFPALWSRSTNREVRIARQIRLDQLMYLSCLLPALRKNIGIQWYRFNGESLSFYMKSIMSVTMTKQIFNQNIRL